MLNKFNIYSYRNYENTVMLFKNNESNTILVFEIRFERQEIGAENFYLIEMLIFSNGLNNCCFKVI